MISTRHLLALAMLAVSAAAMPAAAQATNSIRKLETVAPGSTLQQLAQQNTRLADALQTLSAAAAEKGSVEVIVKMAVRFARERRLRPYEAALQRREIANAAAKLQQALPPGTPLETIEDTPFVRLTLDAAGLKRLESVPNILKIGSADTFNWRRDLLQLFTMARQQTAMPVEDMLLTPNVVGGSAAPLGTHPFHVAIIGNEFTDNIEGLLCSGILWKTKYVVTTGNCADLSTDEAGSPTVSVLYNTKSLSSGGAKVAVTRVNIKSDFTMSSSAGENDVAVLELAQDLTGVALPTVPVSAPAATAAVTLTGWGSAAAGSNVRNATQQIVATALVAKVNGVCQFSGTPEDRLTNVGTTALCAGSQTANACEFDLGAPLTLTSDLTQVVGLVSVPGCDTTPSAITNLTDTTIRAFVNGATADPAVSFTTATVQASEANRFIDVQLSRPNVTATTKSGRALIELRPGTATRSDYRGRYMIARFARGSATASIRIPIRNDTLRESAESFTAVILSVSSNLILGGGNTTATVTITDND